MKIAEKFKSWEHSLSEYVPWESVLESYGDSEEFGVLLIELGYLQRTRQSQSISFVLCFYDANYTLTLFKIRIPLSFSSSLLKIAFIMSCLLISCTFIPKLKS